MSASNAEPMAHTMMRIGSEKLLRSLRCEHPRIVHTLTKKNPMKEHNDDTSYQD